MKLANPFSKIFETVEQANWAFDYMREVLWYVGIVDSADQQFAINYPPSVRAIHLYLGDVVVLGFGEGVIRPIFPDGQFVPDAYKKRTPIKYTTEPLTRYDLVLDDPQTFLRTHQASLHDAAFTLLESYTTNTPKSSRTGESHHQLSDAIFDKQIRQQMFENGLKNISFEEAIAAFDRDGVRASVESAEAKRQAIIERFPLEAWPQLSLDQYALGQKAHQASFCWYLEYGSKSLGSVAGGSSAKHLVYFSPGKQRWFYPNEFEDEQDAWETLRAAFVEAFNLTQAEKWPEVDDVPLLDRANMIRAKAIFVYFPDDLLPIYSPYHLEHFLKRLGITVEKGGVVFLNRQLRAALHTRYPQLADWHPVEIMRLLYFWDDPRQQKSIVRIAPGEQGRYWEDCLANSYIRVGWDEVGDLTQFENKRALQNALREMESVKQHKSSAEQLWLLRELEEGDIVIANRGKSYILAVGTVTAQGYEWRDELAAYRHTVGVAWDISYAQEIETQHRFQSKTVEKMSRAFLESLQAGKTMEADYAVPTRYRQIADALERRGQLLFYGPPGTGKTYHARRFAQWWLRKEARDGAKVFHDDAFGKEVEQRLMAGKSGGRNVWWIVANPKQWKWEQLFADGRVDYRYGRLRENYANVQAGDLVVGYQATPDLKLMAIARVTEGLHEVDGEPKISLAPLTKLANGLTYTEMQSDPVLSQSEPLRNRCQGTLFKLTEDEATHLFEQLGERGNEIPPLAEAAGGVAQLTWITFHPSVTYEDFVEGFRPKPTTNGQISLQLEAGVFKRICQAAMAHPSRNYLLLIDEINRANLAKVFGELITLLEKDKRGLTLTLPQSRDPFQVPPNVYLLGTMNTADRSIKLMDSALRRRFGFIEMMPQPELLDDKVVNGLNVGAFLRYINRHIVRAEGREKQIGHAVLWEVEGMRDFGRIFRQDILPLLQEYSYDNFALLAEWLGGEIVSADQYAFHDAVLFDDAALIAALLRVMGAATA